MTQEGFDDIFIENLLRDPKIRNSFNIKDKKKKKPIENLISSFKEESSNLITVKEELTDSKKIKNFEDLQIFINMNFYGCKILIDN